MNESAPQGDPIERDGFGPRTHLRWPPVEPMAQVPVAPHAAAGIGPTAMRPATAEEAAAIASRFAAVAAPTGARMPLTDERLSEIIMVNAMSDHPTAQGLARAIEKAHGIGQAEGMQP